MTDHEFADKTREYEPAARLAVATEQMMVCITAAVHPVATLPAVNCTLEQVEVVAGLPPVSVAAVAVFKYDGVKLKTILPVSLGNAVMVVNEKVKVPDAVVPGIMSPLKLAVAVPLTLAVPAVMAGTVPEAGVSITAPLLPVVQTM